MVCSWEWLGDFILVLHSVFPPPYTFSFSSSLSLVLLLLLLLLRAGHWTVKPTVVSSCATVVPVSRVPALPPWWRPVPVVRPSCSNSWNWAMQNDRAAPTLFRPVGRRATNPWPVVLVVSRKKKKKKKHLTKHTHGNFKNRKTVTKCLMLTSS